MNLKSWFVTDAEESAPAPSVEQTQSQTTKFPTAETPSQASSFSFPTTPTILYYLVVIFYFSVFC